MLSLWFSGALCNIYVKLLSDDKCSNFTRKNIIDKFSQVNVYSVFNNKFERMNFYKNPYHGNKM